MRYYILQVPSTLNFPDQGLSVIDEVVLWVAFAFIVALFIWLFTTMEK